MPNGDIALDKIKRYLGTGNQGAIDLLIEVYAGQMLKFSTPKKKAEFKKIWNKRLRQEK